MSRSPVLVTGATGRIGRLVVDEELSSETFRRDFAWPGDVVDMPLSAWQASLGRPAFVTASVRDVLGVLPRTFNQWVVDHAAAFGLVAAG